MNRVDRIARPSTKAAVVIPFRRSAQSKWEGVSKLLMHVFLRTTRNNEKIFSPHYAYAGYSTTITALRSGGDMFRILAQALDLRAKQRGGSRSAGKMPANAQTPWTASCWSRKKQSPQQHEAEDRKAIVECLQPLKLGSMLQRKVVDAIMSYEK